MSKVNMSYETEGNKILISIEAIRQVQRKRFVTYIRCYEMKKETYRKQGSLLFNIICTLFGLHQEGLQQHKETYSVYLQNLEVLKRIPLSF